ncbi:MAG: mannosyltransferase [Bacteroidota bacterium]|nr:mannosyltransferase [Bacteroidota bacterium]
MHQPNSSEILFITSYPPRECGIATYSHDLIRALENKFNKSFQISVCALESEYEKHQYADHVKYILDTSDSDAYLKIADTINRDKNIKIVVFQHEFGFYHQHEEEFRRFLFSLIKPVVVVFHTVLPNPDDAMKSNVQNMGAAADALIVMTENSSHMLTDIYDIPQEKINVIPHGTHLVPHIDKKILKEKYGVTGKKILSTFGLLSPGKGIETTLEALPSVIAQNPDVLFLIIGKTHPGIVKHHGESYREMLEAKVSELGLQNHVRFINKYVQLPELLEYLQLTNIYLFTSRDPHQAVSGTFSYALSCGCPIIATPIPHAKEVLRDDAGIIVDFDNPAQLSSAISLLLGDNTLRKNMRLNGLHRISATVWENSAIAHAILFEKISGNKISLQYNLPEFNLDHFKRLTTDFGMIQFSKLNQPDINSGYTLDDNARALIAMCQHYELTNDQDDLKYIRIYFNFIKYCMQPEGYFLNYVDGDKKFTEQNNSINLADANGRAVWALGYFISRAHLFHSSLIDEADVLIQQALDHMQTVHSTRAMAFTIKGLHYYNEKKTSYKSSSLMKVFADRLVQMYKHESEEGWNWFESYLTYANSIIPEAMLYAYMETGEQVYKNIATESFRFLLNMIFNKSCIKVVSNRGWIKKGEVPACFGEQPIDVAYTVMTLSRFYDVFKEEDYLKKMETAFNWFVGSNHLHQIIYNPCTGGCYDGLEEHHVNLNQGAESTVSYMMARCTVEKYFGPPAPKQDKLKPNPQRQLQFNKKIRY